MKMHAPELEFQFKIQANTSQLSIYQVPLKRPLSNESPKTYIHSFTKFSNTLSDNLSPGPSDREASNYLKGSPFFPRKSSVQNFLKLVSQT